MTQPVQRGTHSAHPLFSVNNVPLTNVEHFTYLGSVLSANCDITHEVQQRIKSASADFGRLSSRVFFNHNLTIDTKVAVHKAMCISILLYGSESWTLYRHHFKALEAYHVRCLQAILGVRWWHKVTHSDLHRRAKVQSMECMVMQRQLRWVGHVIRMSPNRLPRRLLYSELQERRHSRGGQMKRFSDHVKLLLKKCQIPPSQL